ncbi:MAG: helix-turn-helix transcriptional regulator [Pseudomonadota bacterium]
MAGPEEVHALWDALSDFDASQSDEAAHRLMGFLAGQGGMWNATWAGAIQMAGEAGASAGEDPLLGWRVAQVKSLLPVPPAAVTAADDCHFKEILRVWDRREIDPSFLLPMRDVGRFRTYSLRRELPAAWFQGAFYREHYGAVGTYDAAFVAFPLNQDCESHFGFYSREPIADETIGRLAYALRGIKWFHRQLMLAHGLLLASAPLTPTEQRVLQLLLTDASEKQIAHQLGLAESTTHQHVVAIFRKFGVRSRPALMSQWLNPAVG